MRLGEGRGEEGEGGQREGEPKISIHGMARGGENNGFAPLSGLHV